MQHELITAYEAGSDKIAMAIRGLTDQDLRVMPDPADGVGKWSIQGVVIHLADAEFAFADRVRRIIAMDDPALLAWDENRFVERLSYDAQSAADAAETVRLVRAQTSRILQASPQADVERTGRHSQRGVQTVLDVLQYAVTHLEHHLKFIHAKRARMGKEMW